LQEEWAVALRFLHTEDVPKTIQVRDLPDRVHGILKARGAHEGLSFSGFLRRALEQMAERPSMGEWLALTQKMKPIHSKDPRLR
jgi:plasmid stability protein